MVENILNGDADLIATSFTIIGERTKVVDFLYPLSEDSLAFAIKSNYVIFSTGTHF